MRAAWAICYTTKQSVGRLVDKNHTGYSYAHFYAEQGKQDKVTPGGWPSWPAAS